MDGMAGVQDTTILQRGPWGSLQGIARYKKPARYLRKLGFLSPAQLQQAHLCKSEIIELVKTLAVDATKKKVMAVKI